VPLVSPWFRLVFFCVLAGPVVWRFLFRFFFPTAVQSSLLFSKLLSCSPCGNSAKDFPAPPRLYRFLFPTRSLYPDPDVSALGTLLIQLTEYCMSVSHQSKFQLPPVKPGSAFFLVSSFLRPPSILAWCRRITFPLDFFLDV